jgi:hypothetical protein
MSFAALAAGDLRCTRTRLWSPAQIGQRVDADLMPFFVPLLRAWPFLNLTVWFPTTTSRSRERRMDEEHGLLRIAACDGGYRASGEGAGFRPALPIVKAGRMTTTSQSPT